MASSKKKKKARPRASGAQCDGLTNVLHSYLTSPTRINKYGPQLDKKSLGLHIGLLIEIKKLQPNMSFAPLKMASVLQEVAKRNSTRWGFSSSDVQCFARDVGPRVRLLCRHFMQNYNKATKPKWFMILLGESSKSIQDLYPKNTC
jgi:hypothetical protein